MKTVLALLFSLLLLSSCAVQRRKNDAKAIEWIAQAKRPIKVINDRFHFFSTDQNHFYTLIDREGKVYYARNVRFLLPEVIE